MKIPGRSLKPLPRRAGDRTYEENKAILDAHVKAFFAPKKPEAKQRYSEKEKKWAMDMLTQPVQCKMNLISDYDREILKQGALSDEKKKSAKSGKQIPQLGEQENQSVPCSYWSPISIRPSKPIWIRTEIYWTP
jgi:hypothetical protein